MATTYKKGDVVTVNTIVPSGPVEAIRMDEEGTVFYLISWTDINGDEQTRWFSEENLVTA
jgi:hypothetical protein